MENNFFFIVFYLFKFLFTSKFLYRLSVNLKRKEIVIIIYYLLYPLFKQENILLRDNSSSFRESWLKKAAITNSLQSH